MSEKWKEGDRPVNKYHAFCMIVEEFKILNKNFDKFFQVIEKEFPEKETNTIAYEDATEVVETIEVKERDYVIASFRKTSDTGKAELYMNPQGLETWVPKSVIKSYSEKEQKLTLVNVKCVQKYINWSEPK